MNKVTLENAVCRAAIVWERNGDEDSSDALREAVKNYMAFIIEDSLPVAEELREPQASDPGIVIRRD